LAPRRVLHINDFPAEALGGAEVLMARTVGLLNGAGWDARTFTQANLPVSRLTPFRYVNNRAARRALRKTVEEFRPDVAHLHNYYHVLSPGILSELRQFKPGIRVVMTAHDYHLVSPNSGGNWFRGGMHTIDPARVGSSKYLLTRRWDHRGPAHSLLKLAQFAWHYRLGRDARQVIDLVLCPSRFLRSMLDHLGLPTLHLPLPNPPVLETPQPRPGRLTLAFAGRLEPEKGLVEFLRLLPESFRGKLLVIGDGSARPAAEGVVRERGLAGRVEFLGRRPHAEALRLIACSHVVLLPSLLFENYPLSLIEALAVGTNILASDLGGMREIVADSGVGYCFPPGDAAQLADRLRQIETAHAAGILNTFDASKFLAGRSEAAYLSALERAYGGGSP
jgi:glycosyltransferase involved in cell wall biosynthesis